jgi:hypothetical protein
VSSFRHKQDNRRTFYLNLVGSVESQLREAYARRHDRGLDTQVSVAKKLGVGRSVVNRRLLGGSNMTIETIADMAWAMGHSVVFKIFDPDEERMNARHIRSEHAGGDGIVSASTTSTPGTVRVQQLHAI